MKMYEVLALEEFYLAVKDSKLPLKTAYKLSRLMKRVEEESQFYFQELNKILDEYAKRDEKGEYVFSEDGSSIVIVSGKEQECNDKLIELKTLEVNLKEFGFALDEFENLNLTISQMASILPLIVE